MLIFVKMDCKLIILQITAVITFSLTIFAFQTKWDFTTMGGEPAILFVAKFFKFSQFLFSRSFIRFRHYSILYGNLLNIFAWKNIDDCKKIFVFNAQ